jgi:hypothetical protein
MDPRKKDPCPACDAELAELSPCEAFMMGAAFGDTCRDMRRDIFEALDEVLCPRHVSLISEAGTVRILEKLKAKTGR